MSDLKILGEQSLISNQPQTDAEGQTITREYRTEAAATMQGPASPMAAVTGHVGNLPTIIQYQGKAGEMANAARTACIGCRHWDNKAMLKFISNSEGPLSSAEDRETLKNMRARATKEGFKLEEFGICRILSDWVEQCVGRDPFFWPSISWREATCPNVCHAGQFKLDVVTPAEPFGLFSPVDMDATKIGANRYDAILKTVQEHNKR